MFDDLDDAELVRAIKTEDPDTYHLIDPLLEGAEQLDPQHPLQLLPGKGQTNEPATSPPPAKLRNGQPYDAAKGAYPLQTIQPLPGPLDTAITTGLRVGGGLAGGMAGSLAGPIGTTAGGMGGMGLGETAAQLYEKRMGYRENLSPVEIGVQTALGAVPLGELGGFGPVARTAIRAGQGALLGGAGTLAENVLEDQPPSLSQVGTSMLAGGVTGGVLHGTGEVVGAGRAALERAAPSFPSEAMGAMPTGGPAPAAADTAPLLQAASALYQQEEARLAAGLSAVYGPDAKPSGTSDYHTALQAKDYLQQLADLRQPPVPIPEMGGVPPPAPPAPLQLPPGSDMGPITADGTISAYPPGVNPDLELVGASAPPPSRIVGGREISGATNAPPPTFEQALESSLQREPGAPRLVRPLTMETEGPPPAAPEPGQLLAPPQKPQIGKIEQGARMGGKPATDTQPRIPDISTPGYDRPYATGPNAGPRQRGEAHGAPRPVIRYVEANGVRTRETVPSALTAEDPGTYSPEVRRELASMAWELEQFPHTREQGGVTRQQIAHLIDSGAAHDASDAIRQLRQSGATSGGAIAGAPVYHDIIEAAKGEQGKGPHAHVTRAEMLQKVRAALLEGKGSTVSDAAAQVARTRLEERASGLRKGSRIRAQRGDEGDSLIGWTDPFGAMALPDQNLTEAKRQAREATDSEVRAATSILKEVGWDGLNPDTHEHFQAYLDEAVRRGQIRPEQPSLTMEGPGGDHGPSVLDFDGLAYPPKPGIPAPPPPKPEWSASAAGPEFQSREEQPGLPGTEGVRDTNNPTPKVADAPFSLTPPPAKPAAGKKQPSLLDRLSSESGVLVLDVPAGDRTGLRKWLQKQEAEHGGEAWFNRADDAMQSGDWDRAWKAAASASVRSYAKAYAAASPQEERQLNAAVRGTPLQADMNAQLIGAARAQAGVNEAPPVKEFPPSRVVTQAGAKRGNATLGPAGILNPGARQRPLSSAAPALRAATLDRSVVRLIMDGVEHPEGLATVPGNTDTYLRLFRQVGEQVYKGENLKLLREAGVKIPPEELAQHFNATISDAGRTLQLLSSFAQAHEDTLHEMAEGMSMGGALQGMIGAPPPRYSGAGRQISAAGTVATNEVIDQVAKDTSTYQSNMLAHDLQARRPVGPLRALNDASYSFMLSQWATAVRNYVSQVGRYSIDSLDHALTIPIAKLTGDADTAALSTALLRERGVIQPGRRGTAVTPKAAWGDTVESIYNFSMDRLNELKPTDARRAIRLLLDAPPQAAEFLGSTGGEDLTSSTIDMPVLRHLTNPKVQRVLTMFNRAQEFSSRATVFDATVRALLRVKGLDPTTTLLRPTPEIVDAVGGRQAFDDLLFTATAQALEATFAARTAKDSIPGALVKLMNEAWPLKLGVPFPRFNWSSAPRFLYDHSPAALLDFVRYPLDAAGLTAPRGTVAGGRLYRGVRAGQILHDDLPALGLKIGQAEKLQGESLQELLGTQREWNVRQRQIARLETRAQAGLPEIADQLTEARRVQDQLGRRRETLKGTIQTQKTVVGDLKSEQKKLLNRVSDATSINAPNASQLLARMTTGTVGLLGSAIFLRSQSGAEGTKWYQYRVDRGPDKDPVMLDLRPYAPFAQYLFVGDVVHDFWKHTDWDGVHQDLKAGGGLAEASPLAWSRAMWNRYEGKYSAEELGSQFAQAFLSISRAAGTTLTLTDLLTQNGWPSLEDASKALVGTIGQFFSRFTLPLKQFGDVAAHFDPEEAKVRMTPKATIDDWERPLGAPIENVPGARRVIPETISQTTGKPIQTEYPLLRTTTGIGTQAKDFAAEEAQRVGVPGSALYLKETGDVGLDRLVAETYSKILQEHLPAVLQDPGYTQLRTPARQRDFLQQAVLPTLKHAALAQVRADLGATEFDAAEVTGEAKRRKDRQQRMLKDLAALEASAGVVPPEIEAAGPPPGLSTSPAAPAPPPPPF